MKLKLSEILNSTVLTEGRKEDEYNKYKDIIDHQREDNDGDSSYDFFVGEMFNVDTNYKYLPWLMKQEYSNHESNDFALTDLQDVVNDFHDIVKTNPKLIHTKDINAYNSPEILRRTVDLAFGERKRKAEEKQAKRDARTVFDSERWMVVTPNTHKASCHYGVDTKWCTTMRDDDSYFDDYTSKGMLYYLIDKDEVSQKKRKELFKIAILMRWNGEEEWYNAMDNRIDDMARSLEQLLPPGLFDAIDKDFEVKQEAQRPKVDLDDLRFVFTDKFNTRLATGEDHETEENGIPPIEFVTSHQNYTFDFEVLDADRNHSHLIFGSVHGYELLDMQNSVVVGFDFDFELGAAGITVTMDVSNSIDWSGFHPGDEIGEEDEVNYTLHYVLPTPYSGEHLDDTVVRLYDEMILKVKYTIKTFIWKMEQLKAIKQKDLERVGMETGGTVLWKPKNDKPNYTFKYPPAPGTWIYKFVSWVKENEGATLHEFYRDVLGWEEGRPQGHMTGFFGPALDSGIIRNERKGRTFGYYLGPNYEAWTQGKLVRDNHYGKSYGINL